MNWALVLLTGLFGSMHCVGMCGAIVAAYTMQEGLYQPQRSDRWRGLSFHLVYNLGRVSSYIFVGAILGAVGGKFTGLKEIGEWFSAIMGGILIISGVWMLRIFPWMGFKENILPASSKQSFFLSLYTKTYGMLLSSPAVESKFYIGLLTPLLPCGFLYSAFVIAAASGSAANGALTMALFGAGIVPALVIVGFVSTFFRFKLRLLGNKLAAITIVVMGTMMFLRGLGLPLPWMMMGRMHHH